MISILKKEFPEYLSSSEFYQSLEEDDEEIEIPKKFYKETKEIESFKDFKKLIKISNFFIMEYPDTVLDYIKNNKDKIFEYFYPYYDELDIKVLFSSFPDFKEYIKLKIKFLIMQLFIFLNSKNKNEEKYYTYKQDDRSNIGIKCKLNKKYYKILVLLFKCVLNKDFSVFNFSKTENKNLYSYNDVNLWIKFLEKTTEFENLELDFNPPEDDSLQGNMYIEIEDMDTSMYITSLDILIVNRNSKLLIQKILNILKNENENYIYYFFSENLYIYGSNIIKNKLNIEKNKILFLILECIEQNSYLKFNSYYYNNIDFDDPYKWIEFLSEYLEYDIIEIKKASNVITIQELQDKINFTLNY